MKRVFKTLIVTAFFLSAPLFLAAQNPPHPNGGGAPNGGNTPVGGGAPIDGGISIMLVLGAAYGAKKAFRFNK
ncbi:MAG TPA: hypothetical protein PK904_04675 [Bacteroidales bacterium]|nr:hypothetical protein [Bacteroidales bacterium]HPE55672.1 hypothetical protein [Bacteroidales bacterium]